ncbi:MAG TPA: maleylpyruvate isomerase family mycothiol-dependent enzyme [Amycolatopsis sp.]|nr:maleylpyruvate isomerase family mycothiol-dependent enzyme [Amycolatopsis sp.]
MHSWNAMSYEGKDTLLHVVRREAEQFFALAGPDDAWAAPTACPGWQVRDAVAHLVDTTESYFVAFDAARSHTEVENGYGLPGMAARVNQRALELRSVPQRELLDRARDDFAKMMEIFDALTPEDWTGLLVPHFYMGPLPSFFYPAFQLMDYGVHSWDIRQGAGRAHGLAGDVADLLAPFMFVLWKYTTRTTPETEPLDVGIRITSGPNTGDTRVRVGPDGFADEAGDLSGAQAIIEFDPGSFVLTVFGRCNTGTIRGDVASAERYLNLFFRI